MRRDVLELRAFYASRLGAAAREIVARRLTEAWGRAEGLDVLGLGYASPFLAPFESARRLVAAMPDAQGAEVWPGDRANRSLLVDDSRLPFANAQFDRVLAVHALEEAENPAALLVEVARVLSASGRAILVAANRTGLWSLGESTPFGFGRPFTRGQIEALVRDAGLEPAAWSRALFAPPLRQAAPYMAGVEAVGARLWPGLSGVILLEVQKRVFALRPIARRARVGALAPAPLTPSPARRAPARASHLEPARRSLTLAPLGEPGGLP